MLTKNICPRCAGHGGETVKAVSRLDNKNVTDFVQCKECGGTGLSKSLLLRLDDLAFLEQINTEQSVIILDMQKQVHELKTSLKEMLEAVNTMENVAKKAKG